MNTMNTPNLIKIEKQDNTWVAKMWFSGKLLIDSFMPLPFTSIATPEQIRASLQVINPKHTIVFN